MKILNVNNTLDSISGGGTAERTIQMSRFLADMNVRCHILTTDYGLGERQSSMFQKESITILPCLLKRYYVPRFKFKEISELLDQINIVHLMNHWSVLNGIIYYFLLFKKIPYVFCPAGALTITGRSKIVKFVYNFIVGKKIARGAKKCIAISRNEMQAFIDYGVSIENILHIPNGVDFSDFIYTDDQYFRQEYNLSSDTILMFIGRLNHIKGPDLLLEAFFELKKCTNNIKLVLIGPDGGMKDSLESMVVKAGVESDVLFVGYLGGEDKSRAYHAADLLVIPSRKEAMSIVVLEAGATGTPVLLTDQCGFNEVAEIQGGKVVPADVIGLKNGLIELLEDKKQLKILGERLKKYVNENYTWKIIASKYLELYREILRMS